MGRPDPNNGGSLARLWKDCTENCEGTLGTGDCTCGAVHFNAGLGAMEAEVRVAAEALCARRPPPEVLVAAVELRRLSETPTGRDAAKASEAWNRHSGTCSTCAPWAKAQSKAPRGKYLLAPECAESDRLLAAYQLAAKAHVEAQEKRARLPLVLVAWVEGLA